MGKPHTDCLDKRVGDHNAIEIVDFSKAIQIKNMHGARSLTDGFAGNRHKRRLVLQTG